MAGQHNITAEPQRAQRKNLSSVPKAFGTDEIHSTASSRKGKFDLMRFFNILNKTSKEIMPEGQSCFALSQSGETDRDRAKEKLSASSVPPR